MPSTTSNTPDEQVTVRTGTVLAVAVAVVALLLAIFAVGRSLSGPTGVQLDEVVAGDDVAEVSAVVVSLSEFSIDAAGGIPSGAVLQVTNDGAAPHNLAIRGTDLTTPVLDPGDSATLDLQGMAPGTYEWWCEVAGHEAAGMTGSVEVVAAGEDVATAPAAGGDHAEHDGYMTKEEADEIEAAMMASLAAFPAETQGQGNQLLEPTEVREDGTKVFDLVADEVAWEVEPGKVVPAMGYNGMIPGPTIKVDLGDRYVVRVTNELDNEATTLHPHGVNGHKVQFDGVAPITQDPIRTGETFEHVFEATEPSVAMYHSHHHSLHQVPDGLVGTIIVGDYAELTGQDGVTQEHVMVLNDAGVIGFSLDGKSFPATKPYTATTGEKVMVHYLNEGVMAHPMHLHGQTGWVVAKDGFPLPAPYRFDTLNVAPGERYTVVYDLQEPGTWIWHCHILSHVKRTDGSMFGMLTAMIVEDAETGSSDGGDF